jgi:glycine betaine/choline ABC-type transport system substrate-binding protein
VRALCWLFLPISLAACASADRVVVGSKNFSEQVILGELIAQYLEARTDLDVDRRLNLGGTFICHEGLISGQLDLYVEYTGTAHAAILQAPPAEGAGAVLAAVREAYSGRFGVDWMEPLGFNNTFAIIVRGEDARRLGLRTISDAAPYAPEWTAGFGYEFAEREDGYRGLVAAYGLGFDGGPREMDLGLVYQALADGEVDIVAGNSTDGLIDALDLVILEDDRSYFPPYEAVPLVRQDLAAAHPEVVQALLDLGGRISETEMREMNYRVDGEHEDVGMVVAEFLASEGLTGGLTGE